MESVVIKPYFENEYGVLYYGDCLDIIPVLNTKVDMILTDPPYGTTACKWDSIIPLEEMWKVVNKVIRPKGSVVMTASQPFTTALISSNIKNFKYCWVWDKHIPRGFQVAKYRPMNRHEDVCVFGEGRCTYNPILVKRDKPIKVKNYSKKRSSNEVKYNDVNKTYTYTHRNPDTIIEGKWEANKGKLHPTQKPVALMEYLIKTYTNESETVLDFCMGSGTTAIAAQNTNRKWIGIEKEKEYCDIIVERLNKAEKENK